MLIKGLDSFFEVALGFLFLLVNPVKLNNALLVLFRDELTEQPRDAFLHFIFQGPVGISPNGQFFWAFVFLAHGFLKMLLVVGLYKKQRWVYPVAGAVFSCFIVYQAWHLFYFPSLFLELLTAFDIVFVFLIAQEYRYQRHNKPNLSS